MIDNKSKYHFIFLSISFQNNLAFCKQLRRISSIEIPFLEFGNISEEMRESLDSYLYIKHSSKFESILQKLILKYPQITFTHLGQVPGTDICKFINTCEEIVLDSIKEGKFYKLISGPLQNLIVEAGQIENNFLFGFYNILNERRCIKIPVGELEQVYNYPYSNMKKYFVNYIKRARDMGSRKAIIVDGDCILYRNVFGYNKMYTTRTHKFVGGSFGFYFTLLKLKELFVEYEIHVVFDGYDVKKFKDNPHYKSNRVKRSDRFKLAYSSNREWVMNFIKAIGFNLYLKEDYEADDLIGSLAINLTEQENYEQIYIYSTDNDFYQLVNDTIHIYQPKVSFRGHSIRITPEEVLKKFNVGDIEKVNWFRALKGDTSDNIPSINTYYSNKYLNIPIVRKSEYLSKIKESDSLLDFKKSMFQEAKFKQFIEDGQFDRNLNLLNINTTIPLNLECFKNEFNRENVLNLLEENSFFKEIEMWERNLKIFHGIWTT